MPSYQYKCDHCGHQFNRILRMLDVQSELPCENCEAKARKLVNVPNVHYMGNGFYSTDGKIPTLDKKGRPTSILEEGQDKRLM